MYITLVGAACCQHCALSCGSALTIARCSSGILAGQSLLVFWKKKAPRSYELVRYSSNST